MQRGAGAGAPGRRGARPSSAGRRRAEGLGAARRHCLVRLDRQAVLNGGPRVVARHRERRAAPRAERHALGVGVHCVPAAPHGRRPAGPRTTARACPMLARGRGAGTGNTHLHPGARNAGMPPAAASVQSCAARLSPAAADSRFGVPREIVPGHSSQSSPPPLHPSSRRVESIPPTPCQHVIWACRCRNL